MRTTIDIDDALMCKVMRLSGLSTKKAVVEAPYAYSFRRTCPGSAGAPAPCCGREKTHLR
jgi:hypothetical protein